MRRWPRAAAAATFASLLVAALSGCATTYDATAITDTGATLQGAVHPQGRPTTWWFQYGTTSAYGSETAHEVGASGDEGYLIQKRVTGLTPATTYHFRACAQGEGLELSCGPDKTFTTRSDRLPTGFAETIAFSGLTDPTALRFSPDGRIFVAELSGIVKVFNGLEDPTPTIFADLRTKVHAFWDRGLLGMALDPAFPTSPFVYVAYTHDAAIGGTAPRWGQPSSSADGCPNPPGATSDGCVVSGRVSRLTAGGDVMTGPEQVLVEDWCQQYPSHSIGALAFAPDGSLYVSGGEGASFIFADFGQRKNPCGDPPGDAGTDLSAPTAEGGALRSQDLRTPGDPAGLGGTVIRVDPETGEGMPGNPGAASSDRNVKRIVAHGLRNPFRITTRPGTSEVWIGDVGWTDVEEINRLSAPTDNVVDNFGWPCYEGPGRQASYDAAQLRICEGLYASGTASPPFYSYSHSSEVLPGDGCGTGSSSVTGIAFGFYPSGPYPADYDGALFFADRSRRCIWVMKRSGGVLPAAGSLTTFLERAENPVDLQVAPSGELFYVDFDGGTIRRITYTDGNRPPIAVATANRTTGALPLTVSFDGSTSDDPDSASPLTFAWDLDGDGQYDDSTSSRPSFTYTSAGTYTARLRVTDAGGATATDAVTIAAGNTRPTATIASPSPGLSWKVGDTIAFQGAAVDEQDGQLPASGLSWSLVLHHCPLSCHAHPQQSWSGTAGAGFTTPDHEYPSYLELRLTATDSGGLQDTQVLRLDPRTVKVTLASSPPGLSLALGGQAAAAPFTRSVIEGSTTTVGAQSPQTLGGTSYSFRSWSDGGTASHDVTFTDDRTLTATFSSP
jgi:glucose/arabinose dehydrogenase/PKD repeat protein